MSKSKCIKPKSAGNAKISELEQEVAKAISDIELAPGQGGELRSELREFHFSGAIEVECPSAKSGGKNAIVVFVPFKVWKETGKRITGRLTRELEKKFSKKHVILVATRTIMNKAWRRTEAGKKNAIRPRNRTLTSVHESILEDVVAPSEIVGKRTRVSAADGSKLLKIFLDGKDKESVSEKLSVYSAVYRKLTNKDAVFAFEQ